MTATPSLTSTPRLGGGVEQQLVEHGAARRIAIGGAVDRRQLAGKHEVAEIETDPADHRAVRRDNAPEEAPALQAGDAGRPDEVC